MRLPVVGPFVRSGQPSATQSILGHELGMLGLGIALVAVVSLHVDSRSRRK